MEQHAKKGNTHTEKDALADWDPRMENYLDQQSSTVMRRGPGSDFSRSANLARNKDVVHEPCGVYVRNIPCSLTTESLRRMFSEHGKVLNVYIGKPRTEFTLSQITWGIIKVDSMKDALDMISALHQKPPFNFKVELSMTEEERQKRKREKMQERQHQQEMEEIVSSRLIASDCRPSNSQLDSASRSLPKAVGRGQILMSVRAKESRVTDQQCENIVPSFKHSNTSQTSLENSLVQCASASHPKTKIIAEMGCGTEAVGKRLARPCIGCDAQGQLRCSICKAWYCGKPCQINDWYYHREKCSPPPPLEDADHEFETSRNISHCIKQSETKDTPPSPLQKHKPKISMYESNGSLSIVSKSPKVETNDGQGNEKQDRHVSGSGEQKILDENFEQQNNFMNKMQSVSPKQKGKIFEEEIHKPENKMQDAQLGEEDILEMGNKIQDAQVIVSNKEIPKRAVDHDTSSASYRTIRNRTIVPSTGKLRRPHCAEFLEVGQNIDDDKQLSRESCVSPRNTYIEPAGSSPNKINRINICDESTQALPSIASANEKRKTCMGKVSASCAKVSQESLTYSSDSESSLTFSSPEEKVNSSMSFRLESYIPDSLLLADTIKVGSVYEGVITLVDSFKQFTVVIKTDKANIILGKAQEVLSNAPHDPNFKPKAGCMVAALSSFDSSWYRAYILELVGGKYNVYYVDFGNMETVEVTKPLPAGLFKELPGLAVVATLHAQVDNEVQNQLQSIVVVNNLVTFKVVGKKTKSVKVSLGSVANYILRPWYSSLPLETSSSHISAGDHSSRSTTESRILTADLSSRLKAEHSIKEAIFQDKEDVDSVRMDCQKKSDSQSLMSLSKHAKKASRMNCVNSIDKLSDSVCNAEDFQERNAVGKLCLKTTTGAEGSNEDENIPFPGFAVKTSENYSLCDSTATCDTFRNCKKEQKEFPLNSRSPRSMVCQVSEKFWAKDLSQMVVENGKEYTVVPVWVDDDNNLYVHLVTKTSQVMEYQKMTRNIMYHCETGAMPSDIQVGELVCGFVIADGLWCRVEVISVESTQVTVHLVDFGNSETLLKKNIRVFNANFMQLPSICVKLKLLGISKENKEARRNLQALVESHLMLKVYSRRENNLEFELYDPQQKMFLNDVLCSRNDRNPTHLESQQKGIPSVASSLTFNIEQENMNACSISLPSAEAIELPSFKEQCTVMRSSTPLQSSSPLHLPSLMQSSMTLELPTPLQPTTSRQLLVDGKQIPSVSSSNPRHEFVSDQKADVSKTSIIKQDAVKTSILQNNVNSVTSQEITDAEDSVKSSVPMYDECKTTTLPISGNVNVVVLEAVNPHTIFVVPQESLHLFGELEVMMDTMNEYCNSRQQCLYRPRQGEICLAKFSQDGKWYRAACLCPGVEDTLIIYIDFANTEVVLHSNILQIPKQFLEIPCIALHCILDGVSTSDVKQQASVRIRELMPPNLPIVVDVLKHNEDGTYTIANSTVTNTLLSEGLVKPIS